MKVGKKKKKESFYVLGYLLELNQKNLAIWKLFCLRNLANLGIFSTENPCIFRLKFGKILHQKKKFANTVLTLRHKS